MVYATVDCRGVGGLENWMFSDYDCRLKFIGKRGAAKWVGIRSSGLRVFCRSNIFGSSNRVVQISPPLSSNTPTNPSYRLICCKAGLYEVDPKDENRTNILPCRAMLADVFGTPNTMQIACRTLMQSISWKMYVSF